MNIKEHWENIFANKQQNEVSWYQPVPKSSIDFFESSNIPLQANIIDIGAGDSYFVDYLVEKGYENISALDISENALQRLKSRLGKKSNKVKWIISDILDFKPAGLYDYWHDRAVFHFLTGKNDVDKYIAIANNSMKKNGTMMIATFSESGPLKCSGLEIKQYSQQSLENVFSKHFQKIKCMNETHATPFNTTQNFTFCSFKKI